MAFEPHVKTAMLSVLQETVGDDVFNGMMDTANRLSESGIADEANALKFAASQAVDESTYDVVEAIVDEATKVGTIGANDKRIIDENLATKAAVAIGATAIKPVTGAVKAAKGKITKKVGDAADSVKTVAGDIATGGNYSKVKEHTKGYNDDRASASTQEANSKYYKERSAAESKAAETSRDAFQKKVKELEDAKRRHAANASSSNADKPKGLLGRVKSAMNSVVGNDANEKREISRLERGMRADGNATTMHAKKATELTAMSTKAQKAAEKLRASAETHRQNNNSAVQSAKKQIALRSSGAGALAGAAIGGIKGAMDVKKLKDSGADEEAISQAKKDALKKAAIGAGAGLAIGAGGGYAGASKFGKKHTIGEAADAAMVAAIRTLQESLTSEEYAVIMDEAVSLVESGITANNADAIKLVASKHLDEASYAIVEAVMDEAILNEGMFNSPLRSHLAKLKEIKDAKPREYDGPKEIKAFVDKYYDDIIKISKIIEAEPDSLRKDSFRYYISSTITIIGSYGALCAYMFGTAGLAAGILGTVGIIGSVVWTITYALISWLRALHDQKAIDDIAKIRNALRKVNSTKLPERDRHRVQDCLRAIDDAETEVSARFKISEAASDADEVRKHRAEYAKAMDELNKQEADAESDTSWSGVGRRVDVAMRKSVKQTENERYETDRCNNRANILADPRKWKGEFAKEREAAKKRTATNENTNVMAAIWGTDNDI